MAVTIDATNLVLIDNANQTTGWTSSMGSLGTETVNPREGGTNLADQASQEQYQVYHTITSENYSNRTIFGWTQNADPGSEGDASGAGFSMYLGDGTNNRSYDCGGSDNYVFFYSGWVGLRLNTAGLPTGFVQNGGGAPTITTITRIGYGGYRPLKATGNTDNTKFDVLRYCSNSNPALLIEGGTTGDRGTFANIVTQDESTTNAWGIIRTLVSGGKSYEVMFGMQMGSLDSTAYFEDSDFQLFLNGQVAQGGTISTGSMDFTFVGGNGFTNVINLDNFFIQSIGTVSNWDMSDTDIDTMNWSNGQFVDMGTFIFQAQDSGNKSVNNTIWTNCGLVDFVGIDADGCTFNGGSNANGAIEWNANSVEENQDNLNFNSDGTGHAIYINIDTASATTYNIDGYIFDGYAGQSGTAGNRVFYINNPSDGDITINVTNCLANNIQGGGDGFSYELAAGTTSNVTINNNVSVTITVQDIDTDPIQNAVVAVYNSDTDVELSNELTDVNGESTFSVAASTPFYARIRKSTTGSTRYFPVETIGNSGAAGVELTVTLNENNIASA